MYFPEFWSQAIICQSILIYQITEPKMGSGEHQFITSQSEIHVSTWGLRLASECTQSREFEPFSSVQSLSCVRLVVTPRIPALQASLSVTNSRVHSNSCPLSRWCHPIISTSVVPFSSCPQSFPASGSFQMSQLFASGGQSIGVSASTSVLPLNTQDWSPLEWTGWISL